MIDTVIIPAAGQGTRLLTATKESPKEMVPVFDKAHNIMLLRPLIEKLFLQMYDSGIRNFYFIVGKKKRAIEDHFSPEKFHANSTTKKDEIFKEIIEDFYHKIEQSNIVWINQSTPRGFGAAVLNAEKVLGKNPFLVQAGDAYIRGKQENISELIHSYDKIKSDVLLYLHKIKDPKEYGLAIAEKIGKNVFFSQKSGRKAKKTNK